MVKISRNVPGQSVKAEFCFLMDMGIYIVYFVLGYIEKTGNNLFLMEHEKKY